MAQPVFVLVCLLALGAATCVSAQAPGAQASTVESITVEVPSSELEAPEPPPVLMTGADPAASEPVGEDTPGSAIFNPFSPAAPVAAGKTAPAVASGRDTPDLLDWPWALVGLIAMALILLRNKASREK